NDHSATPYSLQSEYLNQKEPPAALNSVASASTVDAVARSRLTGSRPPGTGSSTTTKWRGAGRETYRSTRTSSPLLTLIGGARSCQRPSRCTLSSRCTSIPALVSVDAWSVSE